MTREEAIEEILNLKRWFKKEGAISEALEMAIQALSQEPCDDSISRPSVVKFEGTNMACMGGDEIMKEFENNIQKPCDEKAISLERAKKQIGRWIGYIDQDMINRICMSLDALPIVTQKSTECDDAISREAFIKRYDEWMYSEYGKHCEKDALAIRVANSLPSVTQKPVECDDSISRKAAIEAVKQAIYNHDSAIMRLTELPSVTHKSGKWIAHSDGGLWIKYYECSECGRGHTTHSDYCPNCGARMESDK